MALCPPTVQNAQISALDKLVCFVKQARKLTTLRRVTPFDGWKRSHIAAEKHACDFPFGGSRSQTVDRPQHLNEAVPMKCRKLLPTDYISNWLSLKQTEGALNAMQTNLNVIIDRDNEGCAKGRPSVWQPQIQLTFSSGKLQMESGSAVAHHHHLQEAYRVYVLATLI
jgi:hypothetical protein